MTVDEGIVAIDGGLGQDQEGKLTLATKKGDIMIYDLKSKQVENTISRVILLKKPPKKALDREALKKLQVTVSSVRILSGGGLLEVQSWEAGSEVATTRVLNLATETVISKQDYERFHRVKSISIIPSLIFAKSFLHVKHYEDAGGGLGQSHLFQTTFNGVSWET